MEKKTVFSAIEANRFNHCQIVLSLCRIIYRRDFSYGKQIFRIMKILFDKLKYLNSHIFSFVYVHKTCNIIYQIRKLSLNS